MSDHAPNSIRQILRASAISGIGSAVYIAVGIAKTKFVALVLGPGGVGLFGLFQSILSTSGTISGAGLSNSGVRQIAEASADSSPIRLSATRSALIRASALLGLAGMIAVIALRDPIARLTVGDTRYSDDLIMLGFGVWCFVISGAQTGLLNGMHRIGDLARAGIAGSLLSLPITIALVWSYRENGIAAAVALTAFSSLLASWWYQKKLNIPQATVTWGLVRVPLRALISLGVVLMAANLMTTASQLLARVIMTRTMDIAAAGYFQAAWSISMLYLGFALNAMGTDYFPRLTATAHDRTSANKLMNEQLQVALTLTGPVILGMLTFTPQVVHLLFSREFGDTIGILRLQLLGDIFKVASWPLAYLLPSLGHGKLYFSVELCWNTAYLALLWFGLPIGGSIAAGIAYVGAYAIYFIMVLMMIRRISGFTFTSLNRKLLSMYLLCVLTVFWIRRYDSIAAYGIALCIIALAAYYSFTKLSQSLNGFSLSRILKRS